MKREAQSAQSEAKRLRNRCSGLSLWALPLCLLPAAGATARAPEPATTPVATTLVAAPPVATTQRTPRVGAMASSDAALVSNASADEARSVNALLERLQNALRARDANALSFFGAASGSPKSSVPRFKMTHLAVAPGGALARLAFGHVAPGASKVTNTGAEFSDGIAELWLARRGENDFALTDRHWAAPSNAAAKLNEAAFNAWNTLPATSLAGGAIIDLIAERRGGRWIPLRASNIWTGEMLDAAQLAQRAAQMQADGSALTVESNSPNTSRQTTRPDTSPLARRIRNTSLARNALGRGAAVREMQFLSVSTKASPRDAAKEKIAGAKVENPLEASGLSQRKEGKATSRFVVREATTAGAPTDRETSGAPRRAWNVAPWIRAEMKRYEGEMAGTVHLIMQNGPLGWVGLDSVWEDNRALPASTEKAARQARTALEDKRYFSAASHRDLAQALFATGVYGEAADEIQKAIALQPDVATKAQIAQFEAQRDSDPQILAVRQVENEVKISVAKTHPSYLIPALLGEWKSRPSVLGALRISLGYSRLAADTLASDWLEHAQDLESQARERLSDSDRMWINLLKEQLQNRRRVAAKKPGSIIRSTLFTVRINPNDLGAARLLAGLEAAQHTIYADFGIPMSNSEVVLWSNQRDFQRHTGQVSGTATSEFVTALTLTQLVKTESGPEVLSEEINFYTDPRAASLSTIAHEYGHVAVRHLCRGREVPDWINEGIATVVEGGYEDYLPRVREAARKNRLLSMRELQAWQIDSPDGERAFLAYSQANSMMDYIKARWGRQAVLDLLRQIGQDRAPDDVMKIVLGKTPEQLWADWRREGIR